MRATSSPWMVGVVVASLAGCSLVSLDTLQDFDGAGGEGPSAPSSSTASTSATSGPSSSGPATSDATTVDGSGASGGTGGTGATSGGGSGGGEGGAGAAGGPPSTPYADAVLADGPIAYLHLDEAAIEAVARDAIGAYDAAIVGGVTREEPSAVDDAGSRAMYFDGSSGALVLGDVLDFPAGAPFAVELWAKRSPAPPIDGLEWIFSKEQDLNAERKGYCLLFSETLEVGAEVWFGSRSASVAYDHGEVALGAWHHMVVTGDATSLLLYVDGIQYNNGGDTAALADTVGDLVFGAQAGLQNQLDGWLDEIAIYDERLGAAQIDRHIQAAHPR